MADFDAVWKSAALVQDKVPILLLTESQRTRLVSRMLERHLRPREVAYERGDRGDDIFVIVSGFVKSLVRSEDGRDVLVGLLGHGDFFGTLSLSERTERDTTIVALERTHVLQIARVDALDVMRHNEHAMAFMLDRFAEMVRKRDDMITALALQTGRARLAAFLLQLERLGLFLNQSELGAAVGMSRERVNRALADFRRLGLIAQERGRIRLLDAAGLRRETGSR